MHCLKDALLACVVRKCCYAVLLRGVVTKWGGLSKVSVLRINSHLFEFVSNSIFVTETYGPLKEVREKNGQG